MYLTHDGRVVSCGSMAKTLGLKDSIFDTDPAALWRCENLTTLRQQQLTGVRPGYCKQFNCWTGMINTWTADEDGVKMRNLASVHYLILQLLLLRNYDSLARLDGWRVRCLLGSGRDRFWLGSRN